METKACSTPNKLLKLQIDNWGTSSINFILFNFMSAYFTKIKMVYLKT